MKEILNTYQSILNNTKLNIKYTLVLPIVTLMFICYRYYTDFQRLTKGENIEFIVVIFLLSYFIYNYYMLYSLTKSFETANKKVLEDIDKTTLVDTKILNELLFNKAFESFKGYNNYDTTDISDGLTTKELLENKTTHELKQLLDQHLEKNEFHIVDMIRTLLINRNEI